MSTAQTLGLASGRMARVSQGTDGRSADGLVTGEAVPVDLRLAQLPSRVISFFLDAVVPVALLFCALRGIAAFAVSVDSAYDVALVLLAVIGLVVCYPVLWETLSRG